MTKSIENRIKKLENKIMQGNQNIEVVIFTGTDDELMAYYQKELAALGEAEKAGQKIDLDRKALLQKHIELLERAQKVACGGILDGILDY